MKFAVQRKSTDEVVVEAASEEEALAIAQELDAAHFAPCDTDWEVYPANTDEKAANA